MPYQPPLHLTKTIEAELSGFYDSNRSVYIDRVTGLFKYNFNCPPRVHQRARTRCESRPVIFTPRRDPGGSSLVPRMRCVQRPPRYSPYLDYRMQVQTLNKAACLPKEIGSEVVEEFVALLKERGRARRVEEVEDIKKAEELCREFGLNMDVDESLDGSVDGGVGIQREMSTTDSSDGGISSGNDVDCDGFDSSDDSDETFLESSREGTYDEDSTKDNTEDGSDGELESLDDIWESEMNQSYLERIGSVFRW